MHLLTAMLKPIVGVTADTPNAAVMAETSHNWNLCVGYVSVLCQ